MGHWANLLPPFQNTGPLLGQGEPEAFRKGSGLAQEKYQASRDPSVRGRCLAKLQLEHP